MPDIETILSAKDVEIYHLKQENELLKAELLTASKIEDIHMCINTVIESMAKMLDEKEVAAVTELKKCKQAFTVLRQDCTALRQDYLTLHQDFATLHSTMIELGHMPERAA